MAYTTLDPEGAKERLDSPEGWTYLDVRTPEEFAAGHVPGAYNIPYAFRGPMGMELNPAFVEEVKEHFARDAKLVLGCAAGIRSGRACDLLEPAGYTNLVNMDGGFSGRRDQNGSTVVDGWAERRYPVETASASERTYAALKR